MAKQLNRPAPVWADTLQCCQVTCPQCGGPTWQQYTNRRTVTTLRGGVQLHLKVRRCRTPACPRFRRAYRPEAEGRVALPQHEFGLDVVVQIGQWYNHERRSLPEIHVALRTLQLPISPSTVANLLERYTALMALSVLDYSRLHAITSAQGRIILGLDALQPDAGHAALWMLRECLSGEILLVRSLHAASAADLAALIAEVRDALTVPVVAVASDGQPSIRKAFACAMPGVPHRLYQVQSLRPAAQPAYEAGRHAELELRVSAP